MRLGFAAVLGDAAALWRANRDLLVRVTAVFFFLPAFAMQLFPVAEVSLDVATDAPPKQLLQVWFDLMTLLWPWVLGTTLAQTLGTALLLVLLLDERRPTLSEALGRAIRLAPALFVALILSFALVGVGLGIFILPGLYAIGRTLLTGAVLVGEHQTNPLKAIAIGIARTTGNGWMLFLLMFLAAACFWLPESLIEQPRRSLEAVPAAWALLGGAGAAVAAAAALAQLLLQVAAYRVLSSKQGI